MRIVPLAAGWAACSLIVACGGDDASGSEADADAAGDTVARADTADAAPSETRAPGPPAIAITAPLEGAHVGATVHIEGMADDDRGVGTVFVALGPDLPIAAASVDGYHHWALDAAAPEGPFVIAATAWDVDGNPSAAPAIVHVVRPDDLPDTEPPAVVIASPPDGSTPDHPVALLEGTASDDRAVVGMDVYLNDQLLTERAVATEDGFAHWERPVTLIPGVANVLRVVARDASDQLGESTITLNARPIADHTPPDETVTTPIEGEHVATDTLAVAGTAHDANGIREVKVRVATIASDGSLAFGPYVAATSDDGFATWQASVPIPVGAIVVQARAFDTSGVATAVDVTVANDFDPPWSSEQTYDLRLHDEDPRVKVRLGLTRAGIDEVMTPALQQQILLLELDPIGLLVGALDQLKDACGTAWQADDPDPHHDCSQTALGQTFVGPDGTWRTSAEYALVRLLTMTPANVVVDGTSVEGLKDIANGAILGLKIGGGFGQILDETLGIARTDPILSTAAAAQGLDETLVASHPFVQAHGGKVPVTLYDVLHDLEPLGAELGPVGDHPGILDPSVTPEGHLLGPDFEMQMAGVSNIRYLDGADLSHTKDYLAVLDDTTGPTYDDVLELDFADPDSFTIVGLVDRPTMDLRFKVVEDPRFVASCSGDDACKADLPGAPRDAQSVWATPPWELEHGVTQGGYDAYRTRTFDKCYLLLEPVCLAEVAVGRDGNPKGWIHFGVAADLGNPPKNQYLWDLILEVAQVALHRLDADTTIPEGAANVAFTMHDVDVGLTADDVREDVRPYLEAEKHDLGQALFGNYARNDGPVDFWYQRGADGVAYLWFVAPGDARPYPAGYQYAHPGFFADAALTTKVSASDVPASGDQAHEKLALVPGTSTTVYVEDDQPQVYRVRIDVPADPTEVAIHVARKMH